MKKEINILFIGNSYSRNLETFMPYLASLYGINLNVVNLYYGGCSINQHYDFITNKKDVYDIDVYNSKTKTWKYNPNKKFEDVIKLKKWDYVSLQQASIFSGYDNDLQYGKLAILKDMVEKAIRPYSPKFKFIWHLTWSYGIKYPLDDSFNMKLFNEFYGSTKNMFKKIVSTYKTRIAKSKDFVNVIPSGVIIENMRKYFNDCLITTPDQVHLIFKYGCFPCAIGALKKLFNIDIDKLNIKKIGVININANGYKENISFTLEELELIKKAVKDSFEFKL